MSEHENWAIAEMRDLLVKDFNGEPVKLARRDSKKYTEDLIELRKAWKWSKFAKTWTGKRLWDSEEANLTGKDTLETAKTERDQLLAHITNLIHNAAMEVGKGTAVDKLEATCGEIEFFWNRLYGLWEESEEEESMSIDLSEEDESDDESFFAACGEINRTDMDAFIDRGTYYGIVSSEILGALKQNGYQGSNTTCYDNGLEMYHEALNDNAKFVHCAPMTQRCFLCNLFRTCDSQVDVSDGYQHYLGTKCGKVARAVVEYATHLRRTAAEYAKGPVDRPAILEKKRTILRRLADAIQSKSSRKRARTVPTMLELAKEKIRPTQTLSINTKNFDTVIQQGVVRALANTEHHLTVEMDPFFETIAIGGVEIQLPSWTKVAHFYRENASTRSTRRQTVDQLKAFLKEVWAKNAQDAFYSCYTITAPSDWVWVLNWH